MEQQAIEALAARITAPEPPASDPPLDVTGELAALLTWWQRVGTAGEPKARVIEWNPADESASAWAAGIAAADRAVDAGSTLLIPRIRSQTCDQVTARAVISALTRRDPSAIVHQPLGMPDREWMQLCADVRDRATECAALRGQPVELVAGPDARSIAWGAGVLLGAAARRTPCLIDGTCISAAALVADRIAHRARTWWRAGSTSSDPGRIAAMDRLDLLESLPLDLSDDEGRGADATLALLALILH
jgi:nicotinate-nucleotide--dimethylbenzimidazole phosphoribosyltransferase